MRGSQVISQLEAGTNSRQKKEHLQRPLSEKELAQFKQLRTFQNGREEREWAERLKAGEAAGWAIGAWEDFTRKAT